jgi:hypothetical protein
VGEPVGELARPSYTSGVCGSAPRWVLAAP